MTFGLLFKYSFAAGLGATCGVVVVMLFLGIINAIFDIINTICDSDD